MPSNLTAAEVARARLLIVDDEERNVRLLRRVLAQGGYEIIESTSDARETVGLFESFRPDMVLLDLRMPHADGFEVMRELRDRIAPASVLPIIILTADVTPDARQSALEAGASDFLIKPFDAGEVLLRVRNLLRTRFLNLLLEEKVSERTRELEESQFEILERLAQAAEFRDDDTGHHTQRVGETAAQLARALDWEEARVHLLRQAAPLHDVGKIGIPDQILLKPGKLSHEEFAVMQKHTLIGAKLLSNGRSELLHIAERIALTHHERWDGKGYPFQLADEMIPPEGRLLAIVDVFDALTHERPYKPAWTIADALAEITKGAGAQFEPAAVRAFLELPHADLV